MTQEKKFSLLRIAFGCVWAIDAYFKWQPAIRGQIMGVRTQAADGQPAWEAAWINVWVHLANINPLAFGTMIAVVETLLAIALIFGIFPRGAMWCGLLFALMVWSVPQGFGGPYAADTTDIDSGLIYALVFVGLILGNAWKEFSLTAALRRRFIHA